MATRKQAFEAYYKANPDKLKGKTIEQAYAAMRREAARKGTTARSDNQSNYRDPVARRLERTRVASTARAGSGPDNSPEARAKRLSTFESMRSSFSMEGDREKRKLNFAKNNPNAGRKGAAAPNPRRNGTATFNKDPLPWVWQRLNNTNKTGGGSNKSRSGKTKAEEEAAKRRLARLRSGDRGNFGTRAY